MPGESYGLPLFCVFPKSTSWYVVVFSLNKLIFDAVPDESANVASVAGVGTILIKVDTGNLKASKVGHAYRQSSRGNTRCLGN
jgi:hypothetical protein